jgi:hypothetical protein
MSTELNFGRDINGFNAFAPPVSSNKFSATLASGGNATITLPTNVEYWIVAFSFEPGSDMWVAYNGSAAGPVGATFASTNSELNPGARIVPSQNITSAGTSATTINILNNGANSEDVGVMLYAIQ